MVPQPIQTPPCGFCVAPSPWRRVVAYGYRNGEVVLPKLPEIKVDVKIVTHEARPDPTYRPAVQVSLGFHWEGVALPHPDPSHTPTFEAGVRKRFAVKVPIPEKRLLRRLRKFVRKWCVDNLVPLDPALDDTVETWLQKCPYPQRRKEELLREWKQCRGLLEQKHFFVKMFEKDETYVEYKHARAINSRTDVFKCAVGPIFRLIEKEVFSLPWFIKKVPINERPAYIIDRALRQDAVYLATDYTAFEAHFTREMMESCEFILYEYMTSRLPAGPAWMRMVRQVIGGRNRCINKNLTVEINATRMSGEMNTSLGNGFSNLMFMLFAASECGCSEVRGVVEGDDGLFSMSVPAGARLPDVEFFARMGLTMKLERHDTLSSASFCGLVFDPTDRNNVTNPLEAMAEFGFGNWKYRRAKSSTLEQLARCKAFSMAYQYPGCPILKSLSRYVLRSTRRHGKIGSQQFRNILERHVINPYYREQMFEALEHGVPDVEIGMNTRLLVEKLYGITVEAQIEAEEYLDSLTRLQPLRFDRLLPRVPWQWLDYARQYVREVDTTGIDRPVGVWPSSDLLDVFHAA